jgi:hypothetical protein
MIPMVRTRLRIWGSRFESVRARHFLRCSVRIARQSHDARYPWAIGLERRRMARSVERIPIVVRRLVTMIPAFIVVALGVNATNALVISQVVLSIALPLPMITLLIFTRRADIMGQFANGRLTTIAAVVATAAVLFLNVVLILQTLGVPIPGLSSGG